MNGTMTRDNRWKLVQSTENYINMLMALSNIKIGTAKHIENVIKHARPVLGQASKL